MSQPSQPNETRNPDWELIRLFDSAWSVRFRGVEQWILNPSRITRDEALRIQNMLNCLGLRSSGPEPRS